jgi:cell division protein ZipA
MNSELRWTLLALGALFIVALAVWELRRPRQARGADPERSREAVVAREPPAELPPRALREPALALPQMRAREPLVPRELPVFEMGPDPHEAPVPAQRDGTEGAAAGEPAGPPEPPEPPPRLPAAVALESLPRLVPAPEPLVQWPPDEERRVVALRLVAAQPERFAGRSLRQALAAEGFVLGRFAIFHKPDEAQRAVLSAASLTRPGTFDADTMDSQHYGGLSLFAVLPGPMEPPEAFDELVLTARALSERLSGELQDEQGTPLTPARIALLRERLDRGAAS